MDTPDNPFSYLVSKLKSLLPRPSEPAGLSRDFWMPDHSCRVCYECDSQFTLINRRHHCRVCGRIFCAKCTSNWVPASSIDPSTAPGDDSSKIRACNFCYKQWEQGCLAASKEHGVQVASLDLCTSPTDSFISTKSSGTAYSSTITLASMPHSVSSCQQLPYPSQLGPHFSEAMDSNTDENGDVTLSRSDDPSPDIGSPPSHTGYCTSRNDSQFSYQLDSKARQISKTSNGYHNQAILDEIDNDYGSRKVHPDGEIVDGKNMNTSSLYNSIDSLGSEVVQTLEEKGENCNSDECEAPTSLYTSEDIDSEPVDFETNGVLWLPPEPEDEEDEREALLFDDDDDGDATGEWGYLRSSSSFGSGEFRNRDRSNEEHKKVMKNVVDGHFRALVAQLLEVENLSVGEEDEKEKWLDIITSLSWEAASLLKPDTSKGEGMDPGGYVKVKCLASGHRSESMVVKGVVCKKNVAHRQMMSKIEKPRFLVLGGALEYQRVSNHLSSFDTLLQQEMDHLKMAVAKIDAHQPDVLLVEKSVSRYAQEYLLAKDITLVLNIKRPLLERIARCTGAQIVPSIDHLSSQKLGYCDIFHVDKFMEEHGTAGQGGKKLAKTLMYFEGCPKPFGCTILLKGACGDELKKLKHVVQYGVFAAYHLALETSFLADEGASLPELPLNSPITVALPDNPSSIERSISTISNFTVPASAKTQSREPPADEPQRSNSIPTSDLLASVINAPLQKTETLGLPDVPVASSSQSLTASATFDGLGGEPSENRMEMKEAFGAVNSGSNSISAMGNHVFVNGFEPQQINDCGATAANQITSDGSFVDVNRRNVQEDLVSVKEDFPPSPSDHQSILVSLSSRCVWKGTVCERSHLFRIKYYGNFDKPLGRFLRDQLFDEGYRCRSCEMPSEAHVQCYTHRQGTLTISVKKLPEFLLPGEKEGKIWMWHRCLRCPRTNGFPPATRRIVMSDAAWGLSFGKFLELSFSNHAAASRVASCGHSLHRDCLRFYGFGKMVACFRYASIDVHSVYLPPPKLDFSHENQEWIRKEVDEVVDRAELLFSEVLNALSQMADKRLGTGSLDTSMKMLESRRHIADLEVMLQKEKAEFEESLQKVMIHEVKKGQSMIDILEINRLRRQLLFQSYVWDHRLVQAAGITDNNLHVDLSVSSPQQGNEPVRSNEKPIDLPVDQEKSMNYSNASLQDVKPTHDEEAETEGPGCHLEVADHGADKEPPNPSVGEESQSSLDEYKDCDPLISNVVVRRALSEGQFPITASLSDTLDAAWTGENHLKNIVSASPDPEATESSVANKFDSVEPGEDHGGSSKVSLFSPELSTKGPENMEDSVSWLGMPFINFYRSLNKNFLGGSQKLDTVSDYDPIYISSFRETELQGGASWLLPVGVNDTVVPVYDDEPTSIISYALLSRDIKPPDELERSKDGGESIFLSQFADAKMFQSLGSLDELTLESSRTLGLADEGLLSSRISLVSDPLSYTKSLHTRVSFGDDVPPGKVKYTVTCYYAKQFEALRRICCPSEIDYIRSLSRCKKWGAQGGKSNVFFAKTLDDRFIIKQVTKTELESFIKFAYSYFKYLSESINTGSPTCLAKILGIYQVTSKHVKGGKESKMDVLVMENLLFRRNLSRLYDLKGSSRSRYNPDSSGNNKVLLDQNLIEAMPTSPIFVGNKAKRLLERAVWNDTAFLASIDVMDYSLLVGVDEEKHELVLGIIDFMRQYTWDKHLETWVKASGILGGPKNASPTVISPKQYKKRFRKAMTTYFLMVPDQWSPPTIVPSKSQADLCEENSQGGTAATE